MSRRMSARSASRGTGPADEAVRGAAFSVLGSRPRRWGCEGGDLYGRNAGKCGGRSGVVGGERRARGGRRGNGRRRRPFRPTPLPSARPRTCRPRPGAPSSDDSAPPRRRPDAMREKRLGRRFSRLRPARPARARLAAGRVGASETRASVQPRVHTNARVDPEPSDAPRASRATRTRASSRSNRARASLLPRPLGPDCRHRRPPAADALKRHDGGLQPAQERQAAEQADVADDGGRQTHPRR